MKKQAGNKLKSVWFVTAVAVLVLVMFWKELQILQMASKLGYGQLFAIDEKAAKDGNADEQCALGSMYDLGLGVPQNNVHAYMWYRICFYNSKELAEDFIKQVAANMTESQIAEAESKAIRCMESKYEFCD